MSALSTPGGGGTTAQSKPTSGKQKYQKLDINSLYCVNRNENSEPSSVKSQLSRKHGMQSLGKVPSARRPPANLPSLKTESGQDSNANPLSSTATTTTAPPTCTTQSSTTVTASSAAVAGGGGWVPLPPPSSPHFRTEFPSLEAAAQPSHRGAEHSQTQLRPQTEGSWTSGGTAGVRQEQPAPPAAPTSQQTPVYRTIMPPFCMKGNGGGGLSGPSGLSMRTSRAPRAAPAQPQPTPRAFEVLTARPILRDDQINSLDDISRDAGWAQHDDIDYDQKLDFSDGETSAPASSGRGNKSNNNRSNIETERMDTKVHDPGDEDRLWAERRQKQNDEVAQAVARARQLKEEEQRRQMREQSTPAQHKDNRGKDRDREHDKERDSRDRDSRDRDSRDRDSRDKERDRESDRHDNRDARSRGDRERGDNVDKEPRERDRERFDRDRDFRDRDRDYGRERDQANPAFSKTFQANIPPRFLKQQQSRQQEEQQQHKGWAFNNKPAPRRADQPQYNGPRHAPHNNGRRSYLREDEFRRDKEGPQWRSEMHDYDRPNREMERQNSKDSYKEYGDYKDKRNDGDRKSVESNIDHSNRTSAADKLTEVFERKNVPLTEPFATESAPQTHVPERRPSSNASQRESSERDFSQASWADVAQEAADNEQSYSVLKSPFEKTNAVKVDTTDSERIAKDAPRVETEDAKCSNIISAPAQIPNQAILTPANVSSSLSTGPQVQSNTYHGNQHFLNFQQHQPTVATVPPMTVNNQPHSVNFSDNLSKPSIQPITITQSNDQTISSQLQKQTSPEPVTQQSLVKPIFLKSERELSEPESVISKSGSEPSNQHTVKSNISVESLPVGGLTDSQKRPSLVIDEKHVERFGNESSHKVHGKEPVERKSSGSGSEKKGRGYGMFPVYAGRSWGGRESRGRRSHRSSRSNNRASESDGSVDGAPNHERKERRRAPRSPRGPKKPEDAVHVVSSDQIPSLIDGMENREPFAPRGQPSRRGRGGFQGSSRPPAPAKRVAGYGPPNTKSPFSQANRAVKENEDVKDAQVDEKHKNNKARNTSGSTARSEGGRGRDRRGKGPGPPSGEDENWETTSEHSESGGHGGRRRGGPSQHRGQNNRNQNASNRQNNRNNQGARKDNSEVTEAMSDLKLTNKKDDDVADDGFQEVRNKRNAKDSRGPQSKDDNQNQHKQRSHSNQGGARNGSSSRNSNDKSQAGRGSVPLSGKSNSQYDRRPPNLAPRFVKQRQKQMNLVPGFCQDTGAAPPPPPINAWDKPLRANMEDTSDVIESKSPSSQRTSPGDVQPDAKVAITCSHSPDKASVFDGSTPPVETIIFENTNYKSVPASEALKQKYLPNTATGKPQGEEIAPELESSTLAYNGDVRAPPKLIQELIADGGRPTTEGENSLGLMSFETNQKGEDSSDMKLDFAFDSDLAQLTEDKSAKSLGLPRTSHSISGSSTISPSAADLNLKIASVKKVWEMPAVAEGAEELQFAGFEENSAETGAPPNVCKVKPTQQMQSPSPQHYNHVNYPGGYGGLSVPSPPAVMFNSSQQLLGSSQQLPQQYGTFLDQSRGQFGGFPGAPYGAGSGGPYNYQPPPDMFQSLPNQFRMAAAAGGGAAFGQSGQLGNNPSTVLISSSTNSLMSASVKPTTQQIGAIGSKGGVGGVGGVNTYQAQQYLGYSTPVGDAQYSLPGLMPRPAPPANSYYSPYQQAAPAPTYPMQFSQPPQSGAFGSQFISSQLQVAAAVQQMQQQQQQQQQQYRGPMQQQYAAAPRPPMQQQQQLKSPLHEHANGFAPLCDAASPTPKQQQQMKPQKPPHSPPHHKYHQQHHPQQQVGNRAPGGVCRGPVPGAPRYPSPIQRPAAPPAAPPSMYRAPPPRRQPPYYPAQQHHHRNGGTVVSGPAAAPAGEQSATSSDQPTEERPEPAQPAPPAPADVKSES